MILSARYIKKPRRLRMCDRCGHWLDRGCIYIFGGDNMQPGRYCPNAECIDIQDAKIIAALAKAGVVIE